MSALIRRILRFLRNLKVLTVYTVVYQGKGVSSNDFYEQKHWGTRLALKHKFEKIFQVHLLKVRLPKIDQYAVVLFYNSRHDPDNCGGFLKIFLDTLKEKRLKGKLIKKGYVIDDSSKYCKGTMQIFDSTLPTNTFEFQIIEIHGRT